MSHYTTLLLFLVFVLCPGLSPKAADVEVPALLLANVYHEGIELDDYWISEKLDGVRAYWDGQQLISRQGNVFQSPSWFTAGFPKQPLDGELWMGRGTFEECSGAVRRLIPDAAQWHRIRFMVFDLPAGKGNFDQRLLQLRTLFSGLSSPFITLVEQSRLSTHAALMLRLNAVVRQGGEGLMLHRGGSHYMATRSNDLLKLKPYEDADAVVIAHIPGQGKYLGMLGALLVETPEKQRFRIGTGFSDEQRLNPPPPGNTITYKYSGKTRNGLPRFAVFLRERQE
jgi:DNA ligase